MLRKRDPIFWTATGIFALSLVLAMTVDNGFLLLMVAAYLLRPTVHSLGFFPKLVDERQMQIQYQASNVAFVAMVIGNVGVVLYLMGKGDHTWEMVNAVLLIGLAVRAISGLLMVGDPAVAGPRIVMAIGFFVSLFGVLEGGWQGAVVHILPGLAVIGLGFAARKVPKAIAVVLFVLGVALFALISVRAFQGQGPAPWGAAATALLVVAPVLVAAFCLLRGAGQRDDEAAMLTAPPAATGDMQ